jgi:hypothetical protein
LTPTNYEVRPHIKSWRRHCRKCECQHTLIVFSMPDRMSIILPFLMTDGGRRSRNFSTGTFVSKSRSWTSGLNILVFTEMCQE